MIIINKSTVPYDIKLKGDVCMLKNDFKKWMEINNYKNDYLKVTDTGFSINGMQEVSFNKFDRYEFDLWSFSFTYDNAIIPNFDRIKIELYGDWDLYVYFISENECVARHYRTHHNPKYEDFEDDDDNNLDCSLEAIKELYGKDFNQSNLGTVERVNIEDEEYDYSYEQLEELYDTLDNLTNDVADAIEIINNRK